MVLAGILRWDREKIGLGSECYRGVCMQLLNAHMLMEKMAYFSNVQKIKTMHHYICTSPWNISQLLSECYTRQIQI